MHAPNTSLSSAPLLHAGLITLAFFAAEFTAGWISGSLAIMSESMTLLIDIGSYVVAFAAVQVSTWQPTDAYSFGFRRFELVGALITILMNWILALGLFHESFYTFSHPAPVDAPIMFGTAVVGFCRCGWILSRLCQDATATKQKTTLINMEPLLGKNSDKERRGSDVSFSAATINCSHIVVPVGNDLGGVADTCASMSTNGTTEQITSFIGSGSSNINLKVAIFNTTADLIGSGTILVAAAIMIAKPNWTILDPLSSLVVAIATFLAPLAVLRTEVWGVVMEALPDNIHADYVTKTVESLHETAHVQTLKIWSLAHGCNMCIVKIAVCSSAFNLASYLKIGSNGLQHDTGLWGNDLLTKDGDVSEQRNWQGSTDEYEFESIEDETQKQNNGNDVNEFIEFARNRLKQVHGFAEVYIEILFEN
ncbi:hypothetical protein HK100_010563 [Physocladia obscura]|uniref:Cation efflux protein transmembrane domain-containing protein n=1 Tax=Physocladia obscura TaxID=109957 RepID=A0AAD5T566_9FUNG|nr:hypothetical protein HK100_010563 [Physocladia obscura]